MYANLAIKVDFPEPTRPFTSTNELAYTQCDDGGNTKSQKFQRPCGILRFYFQKIFFANVYANLAIKVDFPEPTRPCL